MVVRLASSLLIFKKIFAHWAMMHVFFAVIALVFRPFKWRILIYRVAVFNLFVDWAIKCYFIWISCLFFILFVYPFMDWWPAWCNTHYLIGLFWATWCKMRVYLFIYTRASQMCALLILLEIHFQWRQKQSYFSLWICLDRSHTSAKESRCLFYYNKMKYAMASSQRSLLDLLMPHLINILLVYQFLNHLHWWISTCHMQWSASVFIVYVYIDSFEQ